MKTTALTYSLKSIIKYPDEALSNKLTSVALQDIYHFILLLKSIQCYNTSTGQVIAFNSFHQDNLPVLEKLLSIPTIKKGKSTIDFFYYLNQCVKKGWLKTKGEYYHVLSIKKINLSLKFNCTKKTEFKNHYSFRRLQNIQGIDLQAHRINAIINRKDTQFRYTLLEHPNTTLLCSSTNSHLVDYLVKGLKSKKVNSKKDYFGVSISTICDVGGYGSKKYVHEKIKSMEKQGLKIIKGAFDETTKRYDCNLYNTNIETSFRLNFSNTINNNTSTTTTKREKQLNQTEIKFQNFINNKEVRLIMFDENILTASYLKTTRTGELRKISLKQYSNFLVKMLSNDFFKPILVELLKAENIHVTKKEVGTMFNQYMVSEERFQKIKIDAVELIDNSSGVSTCYNYQPLNTLQSERRRIIEFNNTLMNDYNQSI